MAVYNTGDVAELLRQIGAHDQLLADAYVHGRVSDELSESGKIAMLHKSGLLRPDDELGDYRINSELKNMLNRLMRKQSSYRQLTDMGKVIDTLDDFVSDYRRSVKDGQLDDAEYYLDQLDDLLCEAKDNLNVSLENMHYAISSQFGFVSTLSAKVRENERALDYAKKLLSELQEVDPESCYEWFDWACPTDFARKISGFIYWFNQTLPSLRLIIDNMRLSLFRLRRDEKQASLLRKMVRYLHKHPEFEVSDCLFEDKQLPQTLKYSPPLKLKSYVDTRNCDIAAPLVALVQSLRKQIKSTPLITREESDLALSGIQEIVIKHDFFEEQTETLFERVIKNVMPLSALEYWETSLKSWIKEDQLIDPKEWVELVFSCYCKLTKDQQVALDINPKGELVQGTSHNFTYSDVEISLR